MKEDKRVKELRDDPESILNTNSAKLAEEQPEEKQPRKKVNWKNVLAAVLVVVLVVGVFVGGGLISDAQYKAQLKKEEAQALREGSEVRYLNAPAAVEGSLEYGVTAMHYSQENGMWITMTVVNELGKAAEIKEVGVVLKNGESGAVIVSGKSTVKKWNVADGESKAFSIYFPPEYVKITDDALKKVSMDVSLEHETEN